MTTLSLRARLLIGIAGAAVIATTPIGLHLDASGWTAGPSYAYAKDGRDDDRGSDDRGGRGGDDDRGGGRSDRGSDDRDDGDDDRDDDRDDDDDRADDDNDDNSGRGRGRGRGRGGDDDDDDDRSGGGGTKVEIGRGEIEVERADGTKEEIDGGRYERKDAAGRTVEERPATQADIDRLRGVAGAAGVAATRSIGSGDVAKVEISSTGIEVERTDGTKEEIEGGRYERKDAAGRTVEERPATQADVDRLQLASRSARPAVRRIEVGSIAKAEQSAVGVEIVYSTGWKEEIENGRYELKDPNGDTVVQRTATSRDRARLLALLNG